MLDDTYTTTQDDPQETEQSPEEEKEETIPAKGDSKKADKYVSQLTQLISQDKLSVYHTDLKKFDPSSLEDHYRIDLKDYQCEISHSKQPNSGQDSFVILFTNIKQIRDDHTDKTILAYMHLNQDQFHQFKEASDDQIERRRLAEEERKFQEAMNPIDQILDEISVQSPIDQSNSYHHQATESETEQDPQHSFVSQS